jgi:osmotically-inducible protein OsmY
MANCRTRCGGSSSGPNVNAKDVALLVSDGVMTLTGFVNSYGEKRAAEQAVKRVRGVR